MVSNMSSSVGKAKVIFSLFTSSFFFFYFVEVTLKTYLATPRYDCGQRCKLARSVAEAPLLSNAVELLEMFEAAFKSYSQNLCL